MPLMPATRPVSSINKTAERPIRPPPTPADIGVKLAMLAPQTAEMESLMVLLAKL
jgi:hypothetical protein